MPKKVGKSKRLKIFQRDEWRCWYCGSQVFEFDRGANFANMRTMATVDHLQPQIHGGKHSIENLVTSCLSCNAIKGSRSVEEFRLYLLSKTREFIAIHYLEKALPYLDFPQDHILETIENLKLQARPIVFYRESLEKKDPIASFDSSIFVYEGGPAWRQ